MDTKTINNLEIADASAETRNLIARWRDIVKPGIYCQTGGRWKKDHEPKTLRNERRILEEQLQQAIQKLEQEKFHKQKASNHKHRDSGNGQSTHSWK